MTLLALLLCALTLLPVSRAQPMPPPSPPSVESVLFRVHGDVTVERGQREGVVVVLWGDATIRGDAEFVAVVNGNAVVENARVGELAVVNGQARLRGTSRVAGNVHLVDATLAQDASASVVGDVVRDATYRTGRGLRMFGLLIGLGVSLAVVLWGLLAAAVVPEGVRRAGAAIDGETGSVLLAALLLWMILPALAFLLVGTVIGLPAGLGVLVVLLPALAFAGYLVAGIWLGDLVMDRVGRQAGAAHPYAAAAAGLLLLVFLGWIPVLGALVIAAAVALGSGAITLLAWRRFRAPAARRPIAADLPTPA